MESACSSYSKISVAFFIRDVTFGFSLFASLVFILFYFFKSESADGPDQNFLFLFSLIFLSMKFHDFCLS